MQTKIIHKDLFCLSNNKKTLFITDLINLNKVFYKIFKFKSSIQLVHERNTAY